MAVNTLRTWAEVDLSAIEHNYRIVRMYLPREMKLLVTVKANAYGHGALRVAKLLQGQVDYFALAAMDEAVQLRQAGIFTPMLVLGPVMPGDYVRAAEHQVDLTVSSFAEAQGISQAGVAAGKPVRVHFALDTGMSRIGFACSKQAAEEICRAAELPGIQAVGCFSHFALADSWDQSYSHTQMDRFRRMMDWIDRKDWIFHLYNSAAILELKPAFDMAREGILLYGQAPSRQVNPNRLGEIRPAMSLRSHVSFVKTVKAGTPVSYGCTYAPKEDAVIATVMAGYADGVPRLLSNRGQVLIRGVCAPIVGRVCMDQFMVDVTHIPEVKTGDVATIFGRDGEGEITVEEVAEQAQTIGYELLCGIAPRVPRVYLQNGEVESIARWLPGD